MQQISHDPVTGLPGRALIRDRLANALQRSRRSGLSLVVLFVDLDGFNMVNNTDGHDIGDRLLRKMAERLTEQIRPGDTLARLAEDQFVILCEQIEQPATLSALADRINVALRQPFECDGRRLIVTVSVGLAIGNGNTHCVDDLLTHAETAMLAVKEEGGDGWRFFSPDDHDQDQQRFAIVNGLRTAIERNELSTRFQPIVVAESGRIVGAELLLRWHSSEGEISPSVFIPIAEMTGAIVPIGAWVFRQACLAEADWRRRWGDEAPYVSVNVSVRQLSKDSLFEDFSTILRETGADPTRLLLEITETALMADVALNLRILRQLTELGMRVAVDDFGTGYSSLAQLTRLPVSVLKIDRAFVDGIDTRPDHRAVIRAVIGLGRALGLKLLAEGVETAAQRLELCSDGCELAQGYYFHRPLEESVFVETLEQKLQGGGAPNVKEPLYFLIYVSRASSPMSKTALDALRTQSVKYNRSTGLTGCLLYQDGLFMQMLEGQREVVTALMDKVQADPRHRDMRIVIEGPARRRVFLDWGMLVRDLTPGPNEPDFTSWPGRRLSFLDLAEDPRTCYVYLTAYAGGGISKGLTEDAL